ncbi:uncharacterized protein LOC121389503 [Gigantopelta aegis]|uniref:uncharacterized protein LOC121389503 n=1 Tax=Gigantopelta aegis TaxID=1735272 RepID=UPI001B88B014|nr:uncharacterized protein LOC121389503 [Gigantopelta aegis]XP_041377093.1 uncharacterized protein LOC121389503 [Gigantopelta aegis]
MDVTPLTSAPGQDTRSHLVVVATAPADDYLHPVASKNDLDQVEVTKKDDKQLLKIGGKGGQINLAFDKDLYLLPKTDVDHLTKSKDSPKKHVYVNEGVDRSRTTITVEDGYVPFQPAVPSYVNQPTPYENNLSSLDKLTAGSQENTGISNQESSSAGMVHPSNAVSGKMVRVSDFSESQGFKEATSGTAISNDEYTEPTGDEDPPPDYLEVVAPEPGDLLSTDPARRKLPPLPPNAALFAQSKQ